MQLHRTPTRREPDQLLDHERLNALINNMSEAVLAMDKDSVITLSNSVALDLLDANRLTGKKLGDVVHLIDKAGRPIDLTAMIMSKPVALTNSDWRLQYADGSVINLFFSSSPVRSGFGSASGGGFVLLF